MMAITLLHPALSLMVAPPFALIKGYSMVEEAENEMDNELETLIRVSWLNAYNTMILN